MDDVAAGDQMPLSVQSDMSEAVSSDCDECPAAEFGRLFRTHDARLQRYCGRFAVDLDEAKDLAQSTWLVAWEQRHGFRGSGSFDGWLLRIARTVCTRAVRKRTRTADIATLAALPSPIAADANLAFALQELDDDRLSRVLALPPRRRAVVFARLLLGMSTSEAAVFLQCRPGTVKASLHAAVASLRQIGEAKPSLSVETE
jgi:RNA polymerase sigma-70 factor (ECF subfamily)